MKNSLIIALVFIIAFKVNGQKHLKNIPFRLEEINKRNIVGKQGVWFFYEKSDSTVFSMQNFVNDTLNGYFERYWQNGNVSEKGYYRNGKLESTYIAFWENGIVRARATYQNGALDGIVTVFSDSNSLRFRYRYYNGILDSKFEDQFIESNFRPDSGHYIKIDTIKNIYDSKWNKDWAIYHNDTIHKEVSFYKNRIKFENFFESTKLTKRVVYSKRKPYSIETIFYYKDEELVRTEKY